MSAHDECAPNARHLCDLLLSKLVQRVVPAQRNEAKGLCSIGVGTTFAYVYHSRKGLRIYLRGGEADGKKLTELARGAQSLAISKRASMGSAWAKITPYYLQLESERGVDEAAPLLTYAASQREMDQRRIYHSPSEESAGQMVEGARVMVQVSRVERDPAARRKCIEIFGTHCSVCGFDFGNTYGTLGSGFIHVHHLTPLASTKGRRSVDPRRDLRPVCPNCHEMLHRENPPVTIEALKALILASMQN